LYRKGFTLVVVLALMTLVTSIIMVTWNNSQVNASITSNVYKVKRAQLAAQSGVSHFAALYSNTRITSLGIAIPVTSLSDKTSYKVQIENFLENNRILVVSKGMYVKRGEVVFEYPVRFVWENSTR